MVCIHISIERQSLSILPASNRLSLQVCKVAQLSFLPGTTLHKGDIFVPFIIYAQDKVLWGLNIQADMKLSSALNKSHFTSNNGCSC